MDTDAWTVADNEKKINSWNWGKDQPTPTKDAKDWFCKYHVTSTKTTGFLVVQVE